MTARFPGKGVVKGHNLVRRTVRYGTNVIGEPGAVLFRADIARRIGQFDASLAFVMDLDYWVRLLKLGDAYLIPEALCTFRISRENWSARLGNSRRTQYLEFIEKLSGLGIGTSRIDRFLGRSMATVNELLRRFVYRKIRGVP